MRALITGITGFAGSHLAQILLDRGDKVVGVARSHTKRLDYLSQPIEPIIADLRDPNAVDQLISDVQPDAIYHLAGQAFVPRSWSDPWDTMENNIRPQLNILEAMVKYGSSARLLISTSNEVYGRIAEDQLPVRENTPLHPQNPYGVSKVTQDVMALQYYLSRESMSYGRERSIILAHDKIRFLWLPHLPSKSRRLKPDSTNRSFLSVIWRPNVISPMSLMSPGLMRCWLNMGSLVKPIISARAGLTPFNICWMFCSTILTFGLKLNRTRIGCAPPISRSFTLTTANSAPKPAGSRCTNLKTVYSAY